jgi:hypothetical protein
LIAPFVAEDRRLGRPQATALRGGRGDLLHRGDRLPVADAAKRVSTLFDPRKLYADGYSVGRLRDHAVRRAAWDRHRDQWEGC